MHHDICATAGGLIIRKCHRQFRVHDRESRTAVITAVSALHEALFLRDNGRITHLTSCRRDRQDNAQREASLRLSLIVIEIPDIAFVRDTITDRFRRVDRAAVR